MEDEGRRLGAKFKVTQEFEVIIYYEHGVNADSIEEAEEFIKEDIIELAYNEEGLVVRDSEEASNSNPYIAIVTTEEPEVEMIYHLRKIPKEIEVELKTRGLI